MRTQLRRWCVVLAIGSIAGVPTLRASDSVPGPTGKAIVRAAGVTPVRAVRSDVSPPLSSLAGLPPPSPRVRLASQPRLFVRKTSAPREPVRRELSSTPAPFAVKALAMPSTILNFDGIPFPGVGCNCAPPSSVGAPGATQYVQAVNAGFQVFDKATGASLLGPLSLQSLWSGLTTACDTQPIGDPLVLYDQLANRWVIAQSAGSTLNHECIAVSTTSDATGTFYRYDFVLGDTDFYDYPKLAVWPDAYYLSTDVFNSNVTTYLGPQPFAFERAKMLVGDPSALLVSPGVQTSLTFMMPGDLDGSILPPAGAPNPWLNVDYAGSPWALYRFHVDFVNPANSTFTSAGSLSPAGFADLCLSTRACVPQLNTTDKLDAWGDVSMWRSAYRRFADGHEALVGNRSVSSGSVAGIRWWEIDNATSGTPSFVQESTYQPDATWRWMGSAAMDSRGNLAIGFSASSASIYPEIRFAGRLAGDAANTLAQGEATLLAGTGSQTDTSNRWGDYSELAVDPVDDCTFWYTNEYYATTGTFNWRTRIGSFRFADCSPAHFVRISGTKTADGYPAPGGPMTYTVVLTNSGDLDQPDDPGHEFTDVLAAALTLTGAAATAGTAFADLGSNTVAWDGPIPAGTSVTITIHATIQNNPGLVGTTISNQGTIFFDANRDGVNDTTSMTTTPEAPGGSDPTTLVVGSALPVLSEAAVAVLIACLLVLGAVIVRRFS